MSKLILFRNRKTIKSAQGIQDELFRKMSAGKKIKLASELFNFAKLLNPRNGTRKNAAKIRRYF